MPNAIETLTDLTNNPEYQSAHRWKPQSSHQQNVKRFLAATMDEVRLYWADAYAQDVLQTRDLDDAAHFRHGVMRKELTSDVAYGGQRDHAAHTLNNYLLGWWVYQNAPVIRDTFGIHLAQRGEGDPAAIESGSQRRAFSIVWQWASLLHDVGYLFEGGIDLLSSAVHDERVRRGVEVLRDYFEHRFWLEIGLPSVDERESLLRQTKISIPEFTNNSLAGVFHSLRALPDLKVLSSDVRLNLEGRGRFVPDVLTNGVGLPRDAFDVWALHYESYGQPNMAERMRKLAIAQGELLWRGQPSIGVRTLDHAVCSGLILLQYSTFYFALCAGLNTAEHTDDALDNRVQQAFKNRDGFEYQSGIWWTLNVWGTAAAAVHNLVQVSQGWPVPYTRIDKLVMEEDPVAWLGVLVDVLQEWDRYPVRRGRYVLDASVAMDRLPEQGTDVDLAVASGKLVVTYSDGERAKRVRDELNRVLEGWDAIVEVKPPHQPSGMTHR